jgi:DNA-binding response OmpR family regulator
MDPNCILIVEDLREVSRFLRSALETLEYILAIAEILPGEEVVMDNSRHRINLLVYGYHLPKMMATVQ